jgi:hypothetical protein
MLAFEDLYRLLDENNHIDNYGRESTGLKPFMTVRIPQLLS